MIPQILILEDYLAVALDLRNKIQCLGYGMVGIARSVVEARQFLEREHIDFAILDIQLAGQLSGVDFGADLQERRIPFIYLSSVSKASVLQRAGTTQPQGYLLKPFTLESLRAALKVGLAAHPPQVPSAKSSVHPGPQRKVEHSDVPPQIRKAIRYIQRNLHRKVAVEELATLVSWTSAHFSRSFRQNTGQSPYQYGLTSRLRAAAAMLEEGGRSVSEVADAFGFKNGEHFSRIFKDKIGCSPSSLL